MFFTQLVEDGALLTVAKFSFCCYESTKGHKASLKYPYFCLLTQRLFFCLRNEHAVVIFF